MVKTCKINNFNVNFANIINNIINIIDIMLLLLHEKLWVLRPWKRKTGPETIWGPVFNRLSPY